MKRALRITPLLDFVPEISPRYVAPRHLTSLATRLERARIEPLRLVVSLPPRHGKTETLLHFVAWLLAQDPTTQIVYASYAARLAEKKSRKARELSKRAGVAIEADASARADWRTGAADGGCWATGVEGALTGEGADVVIVDDPHKDRASAESALQREATWEWFSDVVLTRCEPGASVIVCQTRWHEDDLAGRLIAKGWESIVMPALDEEGKALWPERFGAAQLLALREELGEYSWSSLYMAAPRPRGGQLFGDVVFYDKLSDWFSITIGVDLAYSERTHADWSVAVVLARSGNQSFVLDVVRAQEAAPKFRERLAALKSTYPGATWRSYLAGTEKGVADVFASLGVDLGAMRPIGDKFTRAQPVAASWNAGRIFLPRAGHWLNAFVEELKAFTGVKDRHDDQVDALASAFDALAGEQKQRAREERDYRTQLDFARGGWVDPPPEVACLPEAMQKHVLDAMCAGLSFDEAVTPVTVRVAKTQQEWRHGDGPRKEQEIWNDYLIRIGSKAAVPRGTFWKGRLPAARPTDRISDELRDSVANLNARRTR